MKAIFIRPKDVKDLVIFRDKEYYILRIHVSDWSMDVESAHVEDKDACKHLIGAYHLLRDSIRNEASYVELFEE